MGLRRRISAGFISIVGVLILAGAVSFIELNTLSNDTENILGTNRRYKALSDRMLVALRDHNRAFVQMSAFGDWALDSLCVRSLVALDSVIVEARLEAPVPELVDSMVVISAKLKDVTERFMAAPKYDPKYDILRKEFPRLDSLSKSFGRRHYAEYRPIYSDMVTAIDYYVTESQRTLAPGAEQIHNNAYRAVTPVLISLAVMIAIVLMLFFFILLYCVTPIIYMNESLKGYLSFKIPFAPKGQRRDEMQELCDGIDALVKQSKTK